MADTGTSRVIVCCGAASTERRLLAELERVTPRTSEELDPPVRIIVPSRSLRLHLLRKITKVSGATSGVLVQTIGGAAHQILERGGRKTPGRDAAFELLVRRLARLEEVLAAELEELDNGFDVVLGVVRDLMDAGFGPGLEDAVLEQLDDLATTVPGGHLRRAAALVRVAARAVDAGRITGAWPHGAVFRQAEEVLHGQGESVLPSRMVIVHGFADVTGVVADFLKTLLRELRGLILLDRPPDPTAAGSADIGGRYLDRILERMGAYPLEDDPAAPGEFEVALVKAADPESEARHAAEVVRAAVEAGAEPEAIAVVARGFEVLGPPLRRQLSRIGVAFSGVGTRRPGGPARRRAARLAELLSRGTGAGLDSWLESVEGIDDKIELKLGLRVLGLTRLSDLADLDLEDRRVSGGILMPMGVGGFRPAADRPHRYPVDGLRTAVGSARTLADLLEAWPAKVVAKTHRAQSEAILASLGWPSEGPETDEVLGCLARLAGEMPEGLEIERDEWIEVLVSRLRRLGEVPIGGNGGGVQILTVMEARSRTFDHLVLVGVNRGVFPRLGPDDPLLPDAVRARLTAVLPQTPIKARASDEERYLFAQLMSSSPRVVVSWHLGADGRRASPSPFVDRFTAGESPIKPVPAPLLWSDDARRAGARPAYEHAVLTARNGLGGDLDRVFTAAVDEGRVSTGEPAWTVGAAELVGSRLDVVAAATRPESPAAADPWFGFVGSASATGGAAWVTRIEGAAACPWRTFVERSLGVGPVPDPNVDLPDPGPRLVGLVVHEVLESLIARSGGGVGLSLDVALERAPVTVVWPAGDDLETMVGAASRRVIEREGLGGFGLVRLLTARARVLLTVARDRDWGEEGVLPGVLAAEIRGELTPAGTKTALRFRADRLDDGRIATDYKTGKPLSDARKEETRLRHLRLKMAGGEALQPMAYARAFGRSPGVGRFLYLRPDIGETPDDARVVEVAGDDPDLGTVFDRTVAVVLAGLEGGVAFPRVVDVRKKTMDPCLYCGVAEACRRDDGDFSARLKALMDAREGAGDDEIALAREVWWLGVDREGTE